MASRRRRDKTGKKSPKKSKSSKTSPKVRAEKQQYGQEGGDESPDVIEPSGAKSIEDQACQDASKEECTADVDEESSPEKEVVKRGAEEKMLHESTTEGDDIDGRKWDMAEKNSCSLSLDVLAMVASEKFEKEPVYGLNKKLTLRNVQSMEVLNLDQIRLLSDKALVNLFADMTSNELKRNYTYTCFLTPDKCHATFSSFGNEHRARQLVCAHLRQHIEKISEKSDGDEFTAEPNHARKRRLTASKSSTRSIKKKKAAVSTKPPSSYSKSKQEKKNTVFTLLKAAGKSPYVFPKHLIKDYISAKELKGKQKENEFTITSKEARIGSQMKKNIAKKFSTKKSAKKQERKVSDEQKAGGSPSDSEESMEIDVENDDGKDPRLAIRKHADTDKCIAVNDQFIVDLLSRSQPHHDHCYTTIFGKKRGAEMMHFEIESSENESEEDVSSRTSALKFNKHKCFPPQNRASERSLKVLHSAVQGANNTSVPVIQYARLAFAADGTPLVSAEEEVQDFNSNTVAESNSAQRPYPPMPKFELARKGKIFVPEEMVSSGDEAERLLEHLTKRRQKSKPKEGTEEWERRATEQCPHLE